VISILAGKHFNLETLRYHHLEGDVWENEGFNMV